MKIASLTFGSLALLTILAAACASGSDTPDFGGGSPGGGSPSGTGGGTGTGTSTSTGSSTSGGTCAGQPCKTDLDCENICTAAPQGSSNCCDQITLVCYVATTDTCPAQTSSSSTGSSSSGMY